MSSSTARRARDSSVTRVAPVFSQLEGKGDDWVRGLLELASEDGRRIEGLGRATASALAIHRVLQSKPLGTAASLAAATGLTPATVNKSLAHLQRIGVVAELTGRQRGRVFSYARYVGILNEGMALP